MRSDTRDCHDRVDRHFSSLDLSTGAGYRRFLTAQAAAFLPVEAALDRADASSVVSDWPTRRRSDALRADLEALGLGTPAPIDAPEFDTQAAILGAVYVLEGSRLGGAMLARSVRAEAPRAFLAGGNPQAWRTFIGLLDEKLTTATEVGQAVEAARAVFDAFERAAARQPDSSAE